MDESSGKRTGGVDPAIPELSELRFQAVKIREPPTTSLISCPQRLKGQTPPDTRKQALSSSHRPHPHPDPPRPSPDLSAQVSALPAGGTQHSSPEMNSKSRANVLQG